MNWNDTLNYYAFKTIQTLKADVKDVVAQILPMEVVTPGNPISCEELPKQLTLLEALALKKRQLLCTHDNVLNKQIWHRISKRKFELRDEVICVKCLNRVINEL